MFDVMKKELSPIEEDRIAGIALGKTIVVLMYSVLIPVFTLPILSWLEDSDLGTAAQNAILLAIDGTLLGLLIFAVVKGWMPGSRKKGTALPFHTSHSHSLPVSCAVS